MEIKRIIVLLIVSLFSVNLYAAEKTYKIELLVFAQEMPSTETFEQISSEIAWPKKVINLSSYTQVGANQKSLKNQFAKLKRSRNYRPIMHVAWIQSVRKNRLGSAVRINNAERSIKGFFRIQRGKLLHMIVDIEYSSDSMVYRLNEKRRFKLNDTHYLDHPKFGMLARISPIGK